MMEVLKVLSKYSDRKPSVHPLLKMVVLKGIRYGCYILVALTHIPNIKTFTHQTGDNNGKVTLL